METVKASEQMHYEGTCIRPPPEADSILLQVTLGCSHNQCTFCGTYKDKRFAIKEERIIFMTNAGGGRSGYPMGADFYWKCERCWSTLS